MLCKLNKSLYGLRQSSPPPLSALIFTRGLGSTFVALLVYIDDIIVASPNKSLIHEVQNMLQYHFKLKLIGDLKYATRFVIKFVIQNIVFFLGKSEYPPHGQQ